MKIIHKGIIFTPSFTDPYSSEYFTNFNHGPNLVKLNNGGCLAAWFSGPWEGHYQQRILLSRFNGVKWSPAETLQNTHGVADFDPAFVSNGERIFLFYSNARWFEPKLQAQEKGFLGTYCKHSDDEGETWSEPRLVSERHACKANGIVLENIVMLIPVYETEENRVGVFRSVNGGEDWDVFVTEGVEVDLVEPCIIEWMPGKIGMLSRTNLEMFWHCESKDQGVHWSLPEPTAIQCGNAPASMLKLGEHSMIACNTSNSRKQLSIAFLDSFDHAIKQQTAVDWVDQKSMKIVENTVHPSGSDNAATYPSMINYGKNCAMLAWSRYMITDVVHQGMIRYCLITLDASG